MMESRASEIKVAASIGNNSWMVNEREIFRKSWVTRENENIGLGHATELRGRFS